MAKRAKVGQSAHNEAVKMVAQRLTKQKWKVCADLP